MDGLAPRLTGEMGREAILATLPARISDIIRPWAAAAGDRTALIEGGRTLSYGALARLVEEMRGGLVQAAVRPGDRLMIVAENGMAAVVLLLAAAAVGAWAVMVNARLSDREIEQIRADCTPRRMAFALGTSPQARAHAKRFGADPADPALADRDLAVLGPIAWSAADPEASPEPVDGAEEVAVLLYTSGTTGRPKGVMLTHRNLLYIARVSAAIRGLGAADRFYAVMPITHVTGLSVVHLGSLMQGAAVHLVPRFNPAAALAALEGEGISVLLGVPAMFALLIDFARGRGGAIRAPDLRLIGCCGAPLGPALKARAEALFAMPLHNGYGVTETSPTIAQTRMEAPRTDVSLGPLVPGVEARLVAGDGREVAPGEVGEIHVRGPGVMKGYYRAPEATRAVLDPEGWFNTRDLGRFEGGCLFVVGRAQELIIRFGFNVYPPEIEAVLQAHPAVLQAAVIGRQGAGEEEIIAFVCLAAGAAVSAETLAAHAGQGLAPYKRPSRIFLLEAMPASGTGKILKDQLRPLAERLIGNG